MTTPFAPRDDDTDIEEGARFAPRFDDAGLIPAIVSDADSGEVLMFAWMNAEALARTLREGVATFYSRSRARLWKKGETSGEVLEVVEARTDCDQDVIWLKVRPRGRGAACHTGRRSCFYRVIVTGDGEFRLRPEGAERLFDPGEVYRR
ncbi:MAG TPA: phosphoribosyl-AMP cyclohydrolase [Thermopetrobacter sp.]|nr:phosphoribosyl-AMP cyclohydrolase [Thermopetrobacter sp.]